MNEQMTAAELREIAEELRAAEVSADRNARFAIEKGYGDSPLFGNEQAEVHMHREFRSHATRLYALRIRCLKAARALDESVLATPESPEPQP